MRGARATALVLLGALTVSTTAAAQSARPSRSDAPWNEASETADEQQARRSFELGKQAIAGGRFSDARAHFAESLARAPRAAAAFNLAIAYRGMGLPVEALETLETIVDGAYGPVPADRLEQIRQLLDEARRDVCRLTITIGGAPPSVARILRVDGKAGVSATDLPLTLRVNPGAHVIAVSAAGYVGIERRLELHVGESATLSLSLVPAPKQEAPQGRTIFSSPWFWVATSVLVVGAAATALVVSRPTTADPVQDPVFGVTPTSF